MMVEAVNTFLRKFYSRSTIIRVLEPSAGMGGIINGLIKISTHMIEVDAVEINFERVFFLAKNRHLHSFPIHIHANDYLQYNTHTNHSSYDQLEKKYGPNTQYDVIIMNPPYKDTAYMDHFYKAVLEDLDKQKGVVVSLVPANVFYLPNRRARHFRHFLRMIGAEVAYLHGNVCGYPVDVCMVAYKRNTDASAGYEFVWY
jgi:16S rRNA G966 N2-methylase RsmD